MADEAFALSPIDARPSLPTDADYDAIHEAFMETARGRWFLTEYAKRNRNADTRMVLDAVERIEASLASQQRAQAAEAAAAETAPRVELWPELSKAFTKTRIEIAQRLVRDGNAQAFEAIRASVEAIRSVSWALRERGFDGRICDFLDAQVNAITDGYTGLLAESSVADEIETTVLAAFDALIQEIETLTKGGDAETEALDAVVDAVADAMSEDDDATATAADDGAAARAAPPPEEPQPATAEAAPVDAAANPYAGFHEIYGDDCDIEIVDAAPIEHETAAPVVPTEPEINRQRLYEAKLGPHGSASADSISAPGDIEIVDAAGVEADDAPSQPAPPDEQVAQAARMAAAAAPPADQPKDKPASLGQILLANGVIQPAAHRADPLAPFRRMSQAEKVALFT